MVKRAGKETEKTETEIVELSNWQRLAALVQAAFGGGGGRLAEEATYHAVLLITKGRVYYRIIVLV